MLRSLNRIIFKSNSMYPSTVNWFSYSFDISVSHCPSSFVDLGNPVQFVCLSGNDLTLSVCYTKENATVMAFFDVPTLGSSVSVFMLCLIDKLIMVMY